MKIAIEGMDGVGKTTIAKKIAQEHNLIYIEKPLAELFDSENINGKDALSDICDKIYKFDDERIKAWFFGLGNLYSYIQYKDQDIITDRHFASNYFWNGTEKSENIFKNMIDIIQEPDMTIVLYASIETRISRIAKRNPNDYDLTDSEKHVLGYDKIIDFLDRYNFPYQVVNTENKSEEQVFDEVNEILKKLKEKGKNKQICYHL